MTENVKETIDRVVAICEQVKSGSFQSGAGFEKKIERLNEDLTPGVVLGIIEHYEMVIQKMELQTARNNLTMDVIRQIVKEEIANG